MQMKKKGKVYPSPPPPSTQPPPPSSSSSHYLNEDESLSVLRLLPATILVLVSVLSTEDREVLAYLITRGNCGRTSKKKSSISHKPPVFDCECFDCYTNYWLRWDSSPNRELIHEIIEAFENRHLGTGGENNNSVSKKSSKSKKGGKKKEKPGRRVEPMSESHVSTPDNSLAGRLSGAEVVEREPRDAVEEVVVEETVEIPGADGTGGHKGLARKVLPDVLGLLNSSFWRLWNPTNA